MRGAAEDLAKNYRKDLSDNVELRMLADVIGGGQGEFFLAAFHMGSMLTSKNVLFIVDPEGAAHASPDQVELTTWSDTEAQPWVAYNMSHAEEKFRGQRGCSGRGLARCLESVSRTSARNAAIARAASRGLPQLSIHH